MIFEVIVVLIIGAMAFNVAVTYSQSEGINKIRAAEDFAMMIHTLIATPGDVLIEYPKNMSVYTISFIGNEQDDFVRDDVVITPVKGSFPQAASRSFFLSQDYDAFVHGGVLDSVDRVCFHKKGTTIQLMECPDES